MLTARTAESDLPGWPLVGRTDELARISEARAAGACGVVLHAPSGVGKSRLAREAVDAAAAGGASTSWIQATRSAAAVPLGAFALLLPASTARPDPLELMQGVVAALRERAGGRQIVLGVDDAQQLDQTSAALVLHLAVTGTAFIVATARTGERAPDAVISLWKDAGAHRLELGQLSAQDTADLVEAALGGPIEQRLRHWTYDVTAGNVMYVRELVIGALESGALVQRDGLWRLLGAPAPSRSLTEIVGQRLADVPEEERRAVEVLALGEPLHLDETAALVGAEPLASAEARGLVQVTPPSDGDEVRLAHPLYGEVVRRSMPVTRARAVRQRLAATLSARDPRAPADALRIARLLIDAGERVPSDVLVGAAGAAVVAGDADLGAQLAEESLRAEPSFAAAMALVRARVGRQRFEDAARVLAVAEPHITRPEQASDYFEYAIIVLYWGLRRRDQLAELLARAEGWFDDDQAWDRRLEPLRAIVQSTSTAFATSASDAEAALARPGLGDAERRQLEPLHAAALFYEGRTREAHRQIWAVQPKLPIEHQSDAHILALRMALGSDAGLETATLETYMTLTVSESIRRNDVGATGIAATALGCLGFHAARYADAERWLADGATNMSRDTLGVRTRIAALQVGAASMRGDADAAASALARARSARDGREPLPSERPFLILAEGWAHRVEGEHRAAAATLLEGAATLGAMPVYAAITAYEALLAGAPAGRVAELIGDTDAPLAEAFAAHASAAAAGDGERVLAAAAVLDGLGARRYATLATAAAARIFLEAGRTDSARRAALRARDLHVPDQGAPPFVIDGLDAPADALTQREAQLVTLAKQGLTNAEIADRLVLSVRTVESHMYRAMRKLGVTDRRDL